MKIVYIYTSFTIAGGADRVVIEKANYLADHGYDIMIVTDSQKNRSPFFPISSKVKLCDLGIDFEIEYKYIPPIRIFIYMKLMKRYKKKLQELLLKERPDFVITTLGREIDFLTDINDGSIKIGESHIAKPYIRNLHLLDRIGLFHSYIAKKWKKKVSANCKKLDALVLLTENDAKNWVNVKKTYIIPNPLPFYPNQSSTCDNKKAIFVGRMCEQKGYDYLINAWSLVYIKHPDWILNIYGDGEEKKQIQNLILKKGLDKVIFLNETTKDIQDKYLDSSIYILSSRYEGFGMVLLEAMACGVPCVAFDCPYGPADIIKNGEDGFIVNYLDIKELSHRICDIIENTEMRKKMGELAKQNVLRFNKDLIMKKWMDLFTNLSRIKIS
jgi:glycosyltransferase involved in cell wall biosynthesis